MAEYDGGILSKNVDEMERQGDKILTEHDGGGPSRDAEAAEKYDDRTSTENVGLILDTKNGRTWGFK